MGCYNPIASFLNGLFWLSNILILVAKWREIVVVNIVNFKSLNCFVLEVLWLAVFRRADWKHNTSNLLYLGVLWLFNNWHLRHSAFRDTRNRVIRGINLHRFAWNNFFVGLVFESIDFVVECLHWLDFDLIVCLLWVLMISYHILLSKYLLVILHSIFNRRIRHMFVNTTSSESLLYSWALGIHILLLNLLFLQQLILSKARLLILYRNMLILFDCLLKF